MRDDSLRGRRAADTPRERNAPELGQKAGSTRTMTDVTTKSPKSPKSPSRRRRRDGASNVDPLSSGLAAEMGHIFDALPDGVVIVDEDGRILFTNHQTESIFEYGASALVGQPVEVLLPERFREGHPADRLRYAASPRMRPMGTGLQLFGKRSDSSEFPVEISLSPISFANTPLVLAVVRDVTEQRLLEQRARKSMETRLDMLQAILDELPSGVYLARGRDARLILANRQVSSIWGAEWREGQPMRDFLAESGAHVFDLQGHSLAFERLATIRALRAGEAIYQHQEVIRRADGTLLSVLVNAVALSPELFPLLSIAPDLLVAGGSAPAQPTREPVPLALVVHQDVGAIVEAERLKDEFVALAAHELRNPIASLLGYAQILIQATGTFHLSPQASLHMDLAKDRPRERASSAAREWQLDAVQEIMESSHRLAALTDELLDTTRLQANRLELRLEPLELGALIRRVVKRAQVTTHMHAITVATPAEAVLVYADGQRIEQALGNLIINAIKYSPGGGKVEVALEIAPVESRAEDVTGDDAWATASGSGLDDAVRFTPTREFAHVTVRDHGIGIPSDQQHRIFGRFSRAANAREMGIAGTGLGLYLSRELVRLHGGDMWFESVEGDGATFVFVLPRIAVED